MAIAVAASSKMPSVVQHAHNSIGATAPIGTSPTLRISTSLTDVTDGSARMFCSNGCTTDELLNAVTHAAGHPARPQRSDTDPSTREHKRERALALWRGSEPAIGTLVDVYLTARGLPGLAGSTALRFRSDTPHPDYPRLPAMIALVCDVSGTPMGIHRTYLGRNGCKARVEPVKASLGPIWGGAIRLTPMEADKPLIIGEGIETVASAGCLMGLPAWAANQRRQLSQGPSVAARSSARGDSGRPGQGRERRGARCVAAMECRRA